MEDQICEICFSSLKANKIVEGRHLQVGDLFFCSSCWDMSFTLEEVIDPLEGNKEPVPLDKGIEYNL